MEQAVRMETKRFGVAEADDPFRYGWRYVRRTQPDGTTVVDEIPLTRDDLLYPEEGDFVVQEPWHTQDFTYCYSALTAWFAAQSNVVVLGDCRVDWGVPGIRPLGPDIVVLYEVPHWLRQATFHLASEGGTPVLVVEIASPSTRDNDLGIKRAFITRLECRSTSLWTAAQRGKIQYGCLATSAVPPAGSRSLQIPRAA
jgi:colicin import membrane protein